MKIKQGDIELGNGGRAFADNLDFDLTAILGDVECGYLGGIAHIRQIDGSRYRRGSCTTKKVGDDVLLKAHNVVVGVVRVPRRH